MQINASRVMLSYWPPAGGKYDSITSRVMLSYWPPAGGKYDSITDDHSILYYKHQIKYRKQDTKEWTTGRTTSNTWYNATNLVANSIYEFQVAASYDRKTFGPDSDTLWFRTASKL